jgi:hypothetical protein
MRDIRADLRERLETAEASVKAGIAEVEMLKQMLQNEEARFAFSPRTTSEVSATAVAAAVTGGHSLIRIHGGPGTGYRAVGGTITTGSTGNYSGPGASTTPISSNGTLTVTGALNAAATVTGADLDDFLVRAVRRGVYDKDELRDGAIRAGYFTGSINSPGRVVHARLTNLVRDGKLAKVDDRYVVEDNMKTAP